MSWSKMNRLHLHVIDSQSWPLEVPALPRLAEQGAFRKGLTYSPGDVAAIYEYATHRGVEVIMEIDMPGHMGPVQLAYDDPGVRSTSPAAIAPRLQSFLDRAHAKVREAGMTPFVWEEMVVTWNQTLGRDVVQAWLGNGSVKKLAEAGH